MLRRYLVFSGRIDEIRRAINAVCARQNLAIALEEEGIIVVASEDLIAVKLDDQGLILGDVYMNDPPFARIHAMSSDQWRAMAAHIAGEGPPPRLWGHFIAVSLADKRGAHMMYRPPFGSVGAYYSTTPTGTAIASDVDLLRELGVVTAAIDWQSIARHLIAPNLRSERTCLRGIAELAAGSALAITDGGARTSTRWNPWDLVRRADQLTDETEAVALIRQYVDGCVATLAGSTHHAVLGVSGGLDSSIVAAALAKNGTPFSCLTLYTRDPAGDERHYARVLASHLGVELSEALEDVANVDVTRSDASHLPRPLARGFAQSGDRANALLAEAVGADAFFSGGGGDNVFCYLQSAAPVTDCLLTGRFGNAWQAARDMSQIAGCSTWAALRGGLKRAAHGRRAYQWRPDLGFLSPDLADEAEAACMPQWADAPRDALPGKATHIAWLVGILNHIEGYGRERTRRTLWPLLALPIVELCLRIPSWLWNRGGQNRALARRAYADILPREILERRFKGTPDCFVIELFEANRKLIRDFLCDGQLASNAVVNPDQVAQFLAADGPVRGLGYWRIMALTDVEAWIQTISNAPQNHGADRPPAAPVLKDRHRSY